MEPGAEAVTQVEDPAPRAPRGVRSGFVLLAAVLVASWGAGMLGAFVGVRLAHNREVPARVPSTLGLVKVTPREQPLPAMDVSAAAGAVGPSVVAVQALVPSNAGNRRAAGTGIVLTADGEIVTNAHVIAGAVTIDVRVPGETEPRAAVVLASDSSRDLALLRIDASGLAPATFAAAGDVRVGDAVVAVGYALDIDGDPTVTSGIVSAVGRSSSDGRRALNGLIQTDAPISSGNSGGPLVNSLGQVVGITTFVAVADPGGQANNLGFAISNAELLPSIELLRQAARGSPVPSGYLGVNVTGRTDGGSGALISEVVVKSPAAAAGLTVGDAVVAVDHVVITGEASLVAAIRDHRPGDTIVLDVMRGGRRVTLTATLTGGTSG